VGKDGDWSVNDSWNPAGVTQSGDQVVIASGEPSIKSGGPPLDKPGAGRVLS
jgi:hypothetical protein